MSAPYNPVYQPAVWVPVELTVDVDAFQFISQLGSPCIAGEQAKGITEQAGNDGDRVSLIAGGTALLSIKEGLTAGDMIASNANGFGVKAAQGDFVNAIAVETGDTDTTITVQFGSFYLGSPYA